jgi:hypothetical protein
VYEHVESLLGALDRPEWASLPNHGERIRRLTAEVPPAVWHKVQTAIAMKYHELEHRYGRATALAIISAGIVGTAVPLPGTTIVAVAPLIGMAELHHRLTTTTGPAAEFVAKLTHGEAELRRLGQRWLEDLALLLGMNDDVATTSGGSRRPNPEGA